MKQAKSIRQTYQLEIQTLTPVHIGCGKKFCQHFDYIQEGGKIQVFDQACLFAQVKALGEDAIADFITALEGHKLSDFIKEKKIDLKLLYSFTWTSKPVDIRRYIRDGLGCPFIPGSSLKGLFRSAILSRLVEEDGAQIKLKDIPETMLGKDAKYNLMRSLTVSDCLLSAKSMQVDEAFITTIVTGGRRFERKRWSMLIEHVRKGESTTTGQISFDLYLQEKAQGEAKPEFNFRATLTLEWLLKALRDRTERFLKAELLFLADKSGEGVPELQRFYTRLQQETSRLDSSAAIVQFAWGSGWKAMTGELLQPDQLTRDLRSKLGLAENYLDFPFPKSRRLVGRGKDVRPIGWVKLTFKEKGGDSRSVPKKTVDPRQILLNKIEAVQNWDDLKKVAMSDSGFADNRTHADVAETFKAAALRVRVNFPKKWDDERDRQVKEWMEASGVAWAVDDDWTGESPLPDGTKQSNNRVIAAAFKDFNNWQQHRAQLGLAIENLTLPEVQSLHELFVQWKVNVATNEKQKKAWKALKTRLKTLQKANT